MDSHRRHRTKGLSLFTGVILAAALLLSVTGCLVREVPAPASIQIQNVLPAWTVEGEDTLLSVTVSDHTRVEEVYIQFSDGSRQPLAKVEGKVSAWETSLRLPPGHHAFSIIAGEHVDVAKVDGEITVYPLDADNDGMGYRDELRFGTDPNERNPIAKCALPKNVAAYLPQLLSLENDGVVDENDKAFVDLVAKYAKAGEVVPGIYAELLLLPDLYTGTRLNMGTDNIGALGKILQSAGDPAHKEAFLEMLAQGISGKRKYCTGLQALLWEAYENKDLGSLLSQFSLERLIKGAWTNTSQSGNYQSARWKNFDEVVDRLSSPEAAYWFNEEYFTCESEDFLVMRDINTWLTPEEFFHERTGTCIDYAAFITYCLLANGYTNQVEANENNAVCTVIAFATTLSPVPHGVNAVTDNGKIYLFDASHHWTERGPFASIRDMVQGNVTPYWSPWVTCLVMSERPWEANKVILSKYFEPKLQTKAMRETVKAQLVALPWFAQGRNSWVIEKLDSLGEGPVSDEFFRPSVQ